MSNLTIQVDRGVLLQARMRALREGTSVNALLREYLERYAGLEKERQAAAEDLLKLARKAESRSGGRQWSREKLHER